MRAASVMLFVGVLAASAAGAQDLGQAVEASYRTNLAMLTEAANSAVDELFAGFNAPAGATLLVEPAADHEANWFVENLVLAKLTEGGFSAYLKKAPMVGPEVPAGIIDSTATAPAKAAVEEPPSPDDRADLVLRYRVAEFGILYPESHRKSPLGSRRVQRLAAVSLYANLLKGKREDVTWVGTGDAERMDVVPAGKLPLLEGKTFPFAKPVLETRGLGGLVEPALVTGIVVGLIYLFYTNQK
jgi:hypothetical protein